MWLRLFIPLDAEFVDEISVAAAVEVGDAGNDACIFHLQYGLSSVHGQSSSAVKKVSLLSIRV